MEWEQTLKVSRSERLLQVNLSQKNLSDKEAFLWCAWALGKGAVPRVDVQKIDVSMNLLTTTGFSAILQGASALGGKLLTVKAFKNMIEEIPQELLKCDLEQLHLSHNKLKLPTLQRFIVGVVGKTCGEKVYPLEGLRPLWLRVEQNPGAKELALALRMIEGDAICFVDGTTCCSPYKCYAKLKPPSLHLTYIDLPAYMMCAKDKTKSMEPTFPTFPTPLRSKPIIPGAWSPEAAAERAARLSALLEKDEVETSFSSFAVKVVQAYNAEAGGYLSVSKGANLDVLHGPDPGDAGNKWLSYYYVEHVVSKKKGWLPVEVCVEG